MHRDHHNCGHWEAEIVDLHDGTLPPEDERQLRAHALACPGCAALLESAERGKRWAQLLHDVPPQPPVELLGKILERTGFEPTLSMEGLCLPHPAHVAPQGYAGALLTAGMAFFSLALTFSVSGLHPRDLQPATVAATASRQFFGAKKQIVSFYDNLRVVRELELTVETLRGAGQLEPQSRADSIHLPPDVLWADAQTFPTVSVENRRTP